MGRACLLIVSVTGLEERKKGKAGERQKNSMGTGGLELTG